MDEGASAVPAERQAAATGEAAPARDPVSSLSARRTGGTRQAPRVVHREKVRFAVVEVVGRVQHLHDIEWTPAGVKFFVDGTLLRTWTANISRLKLPQNILLTIWASNSASWAGALGASSVPTSAEVDWIKVYQLQ